MRMKLSGACAALALLATAVANYAGAGQTVVAVVGGLAGLLAVSFLWDLGEFVADRRKRG